MAKPPIRIKRSAVSGAIPTTAQLALGELAINTADGKVFLKKDDGAESIVEIGTSGSYTSPSALALYEKNNSGTPDSFDGVETRFQLRDTAGNPVTIASALFAAISVNGVVQKPNEGTPSSPFEGFYIAANATQGYDIVFDTAPATGSDFFGVLAGTFTATGGTSGIKILDDISSQFNGSLTAFTLEYNAATYTPDFPNAIIVSLGGVVQVPTDAYSISGSTITFTAAPPTGTSFHALSFEIGEAVTGVTDVIATSPLASTGGTTPVISIQDGTTSQKGAVQLEDSTSSTSTTTAATPNSVKSAYDLADAALPEAGGTLSGVLGVTAGSASAPGVCFSGDTNTGIYSPGADQLAISTNGTGRLFVDASGRVGVGTNAPDQDLVVEDSQNTGTTADNVGVTIRSVNRSSLLRLTSNPSFSNTIELGDTDATNAGAISYNNSNNNLFFTVNGSERLRITSDGKVGLGTSNPNQLLDVRGNSNPQLKISETNNSTSAGVYIENQGQRNWQIWANRATDTLNFGANARANTFLAINGATGRVGVGTTSPGDLLHVMESSASAAAAPTASVAQFERNGACAITISSTNTSTGSVFFGDDASAAIGRVQFDHSNNSLQFWSTLERARIDSAGRLLVGTSSDSGGALLQVNGDRIRVGTAKTPASATATGTAGEICWDASYVYVCTATNTWKRSALSTW